MTRPSRGPGEMSRWGVFGLAAATAWLSAAGEEPTSGAAPALVIRAVHPDRQAAAVIRLFEGSRAAHPAAAMAAWRRATADIGQVGKPLQAAAAMFNPQMVAEWKAFHAAELTVDFDPSSGKPLWRVIAPEDDGTLAALITSLRLSGGDDEPPLSDPPVVVERLGPPGAALAARLPEGVAFASDRARLAEAVASLRANGSKMDDPAPDASGFRIALDPDRLAPPGSTSMPLLRVAAAARAAGVRTLTGLLAMEDDHLDLNLSTPLEGETTPAAEGRPPVLDPSWLACVPAEHAQGAVAIALGRGPGFWDRMFEVADRVDRADPARAGVSPLRVRLNLLASARGVKLEADLWPSLRGVTAAALADPDRPGRTGGVLIALQTDRAEDAERILTRVLTPLAGLLGGAKAGPGSKVVELGRLSGRPIEAALRGPAVILGWSDGALGCGLASMDHPDASVATILERAGAGAGGRPLSRAGVYWPGRLALPIKGYDPSSPLAAALSEGSPILWRGGEEGGRAWDMIRWPDLRRLVARFLDRVPQAPPDAP